MIGHVVGLPHRRDGSKIERLARLPIRHHWGTILEHGAFSIGISARNRTGDLSDLGEEFYMIEALSVDLV